MITLATLSQATEQEVFDQVYIHLLTQNKKSRDRTTCLYRYNGLKCAAGCLISDNEYQPEMEGRNWYLLYTNFNITNNHHNLINDLQIIHDKKAVEDWENELSILAESYSLTIPKIK